MAAHLRRELLLTLVTSVIYAQLTAGLGRQGALIAGDARLRNAIVPGELILIPQGPKEAKHHGSRGNEITEASPQQLLRRWIEAIETDNAKSAERHSGRGGPKVSEKGDV